MTELPKAYTPRDVEGAIYERWLAADVFAPDGAGSTADPDLPPFTIIQPPPNVTGSLHLGHAQRTTVEDLMVRHARMRGHPTLFLPGLDHASIAAQFVLDGILAEEGESRRVARSRALPRADARVLRRDPAGHARPAAAGRRLGRLGPPALHDGRGLGAGRAGRLRAPVPRRPRVPDRGAHQLVPGLPDERVRPRGHRRPRRPARCGPSATTSSTRRPASPIPNATITVATTRPETILGDTAVAVHPDDERYAALVGRRVRIPFVERDVPIIADDVVERAFGTGAVKITPAHDHDDHATGLRHGLPMPTILADDATITGTGTPLRRPGPLRGAPTDRRGRSPSAATSSAERAARDGHRALPAQRRRRRAAPQDAVVHPDRAARRARAGCDPVAAATRILPERFEKTWEHWLTNIRDWNVSRQLWWGHRIPAWYCPDGHVTVSSRSGRPGGLRGLRPTGRRARSRTRTSSTPGSAPACGRSRRSAGRTRRPTWRASTRPRSWRPATTSSSSGSPG